MSNNLELRVLDDDELMDVVGGTSSDCKPKCTPCEPCDEFDIDISVEVDVCL